eukprot:SAG31_NODE_3392_length_4326_cov_2.768630_2_plen_46_part_00
MIDDGSLHVRLVGMVDEPCQITLDRIVKRRYCGTSSMLARGVDHS